MRLIKRGPFQWVIHGDGDFGGGLYPTERSYLQLTFWHGKWQSESLSICAPGIGDLRIEWERYIPVQMQLLRLERHRQRRHAKFSIGPLVVWRRSYPEVIKLNAEAKYRNRLSQEKREREQRT